MVRSVRGYDNALAESQIGAYKTERIRPEGPWRDGRALEIETLNWVDWFNTERAHESVDDLAPIRPRKFTTLQETISSRPGRDTTRSLWNSPVRQAEVRHHF